MVYLLLAGLAINMAKMTRVAESGEGFYRGIEQRDGKEREEEKRRRRADERETSKEQTTDTDTWI